MLQYEVIIVGGGIVGLSIAASLVERNIKNILVLERSLVPYGASTRNAGFACYGSLTEVLSDIDSMGPQSARELLFNRWMGLQITRKRLKDEAIGYEHAGGYELIEKDVEHHLNRVEEVNQLVADFLPNYVQDADELKQSLGIHSDGKLVKMAEEGQLNPGKLVHSLQRYVSENGVDIKTGAVVRKIEQSDSSVFATVSDGTRDDVDYEAKKLVVAVNGFAKQFLPETQLSPGRGQVFITHPIPNLKFVGNLHIDEGYYYFRNVGDRLLIGGARNIDFDAESTEQIELNDKIQSHLEQKSQEIFQLHDSFAVDMRWSGIMAFGENKQPIVERSGQHIYLALRMGGMGVALAGSVGEDIAEMIEEDGL